MHPSRKTYLAGPIAGQLDYQCKTWREWVKDRLGAEVCLDPMDRDYRGIENDTPPAAIVDPDIADIASCEYVLVNASTGPSWGTAMELVYAHQLGRRTVIVLPVGTKVPSPWVRYHTEAVAHDIPEAVDLLRTWEQER